MLHVIAANAEPDRLVESAAILYLLAEKNFDLSEILNAVIAIGNKTGAFYWKAKTLHVLYEINGQSSEVAATLADAFAAVGDQQNLVRLSDKHLPFIQEQKNYSPWKRWIYVLLKSGLYSFASKWLESYPVNEGSNYLRRRCKTYLPDISCGLPIYVIDLEKDRRRYEVLSRSFANAGYKNLIRYSAIYGSQLPSTLIAHFSPKDIARYLGNGGIDCWLSHLRVWEIVAQGEDDYAMVVEDDATPFVHANYLAESWASIEKNDLTWVNARISPIIGHTSSAWGQQLLSTWDVMAEWSPHRTSSGADGYIISRDSARKMVDAANKQGIRAHLDGQMLAWSVSPVGSPRHPLQEFIIDFQSRTETPSFLNSGCLAVPLVEQNDLGLSARIRAGL